MEHRIMNKTIWLLLALVLLPLTLSAQKKEMSQAKQWIKAGNNLENAEQSMRKLLTDSANRRNDKIWELLLSEATIRHGKALHAQ